MLKISLYAGFAQFSFPAICGPPPRFSVIHRVIPKTRLNHLRAAPDSPPNPPRFTQVTARVGVNRDDSAALSLFDSQIYPIPPRCFTLIHPKMPLRTTVRGGFVVNHSGSEAENLLFRGFFRFSCHKSATQMPVACTPEAESVIPARSRLSMFFMTL